jgi:hypothetical protein
MQQTSRRQIRGDRRAIWDSAASGGPSPAYDLRAADDPNARIAEMLARLARSAAS